MRQKLFESIFISLLVGLTIAVPAMGDKAPSGRDLSLSHSKRCAEVTANMQGKVEKLQEEIAQGRRIYTPAEIKKLEAILMETEEKMDAMMHRPGDAEIDETTVKGSIAPSK